MLKLVLIQNIHVLIKLVLHIVFCQKLNKQFILQDCGDLELFTKKTSKLKILSDMTFSYVSHIAKWYDT